MQDSPDIALKVIENEKALAELELDAAARAFTGERVPRFYPIFVVFYKGKFAGYFQTRQQIVIYPELHPHMVGGMHNYVDLVSTLATETVRNCGNPIFLLCKKANGFGNALLKRMRLKRADETAYIYAED